MTYADKLALAKKFNERIKSGIAVNQLNVQKMILASEIKPEDLNMLIAVYDAYKVGVKYSKGMKFHDKGVLYEVVQPVAPAFHTSQADWVPSTTPSLYTRITPGAIIAPWEQRYGHNPYKPGDKVTWNSKTYECTLQTTYSPTDYAQAWKLA